MLRSKVNSLGNPFDQSWRRKEGYGGKDLQKSKVLSLEWRSEGWWNTNIVSMNVNSCIIMLKSLCLDASLIGCHDTARPHLLLITVLRYCCHWAPRHLLSSGRSAANPLHATVDLWDRQTDARSFHRPCSAYCAGSLSKDVLRVINICQHIR